MTDEARPSIEILKEVAQELLRLATVRLPVRIEGTAVPDDHRDRRYTPLWLDEPSGHRYWMSALYVRTITAYESALLLADAGLDPDARAHLRIMFDYLVAFAWLAIEPENHERSFRLIRYGSGFRERMIMEVAEQSTPGSAASPELIDELALAIELNEKVKQPPSVAQMCDEVDAHWRDLLSALGDEAIFRRWHTLVYRGASGFLHVTATGMDAVVHAEGGAFIVQRPTSTIDRVYEIAVGLTAALLAIATHAAPWLVDDQTLAQVEHLVRA
jgi:hypothetical protein